MTQTTNPLKQYFRQPAIYIKLPSNGNFWPEGSLEMPQNQEIPVYPMTAIDEITYRTPDALFNGQSVVNVVQSCIPAIKNAWNMPFADLNSLLVAIRIASYGHDMDVGTVCPHCEHDDVMTLDLVQVLGSIERADYSEPMVHGDLEIHFKPMTYEQQNSSNLEQFEYQRQMRMITASESDDEDSKIKAMNSLMTQITKLALTAITNSISAIRAPSTIVTEPKHIEEFLQQCDRKVYVAIRDHVISLRTKGDMKPVHVKCAGCEKEYDQALSLDMANFFGPAS